MLVMMMVVGSIAGSRRQGLLLLLWRLRVMVGVAQVVFLICRSHITAPIAMVMVVVLLPVSIIIAMIAFRS